METKQLKVNIQEEDDLKALLGATSGEYWTMEGT